VTDGTGAGTRKIGPQFVFEQDLSHILFKGRFYFLGANAAFQAILWVTDGTEAGTFPFRDGEGMEIAVPQRFAVLGDRLVFTSGYGMTLWESDGTPQGTFRLIPETRPDSRSIPELVRAGSRVFFPAYSRENGVELWAVEESHP
jgi:ELWxxDGT repeat protein